MKNFFLTLIAIAIFTTPIYSQNGKGPDPGLPDSIVITCDSLIVGRSMPITVRIVNDYPLKNIFTKFDLEYINGGAMSFDSIRYLNTLVDPSVLDYRGGSYTDTLITIFAINFFGNDLPIDAEEILQLYYTAHSPGSVILDSTHLPPTHDFAFTAQLPGQYIAYEPNFEKISINIVNGTPFPEISIQNSELTTFPGEIITEGVSLNSPVGFPMNLSIKSFTRFDNTETPVSSPFITDNSNYAFNWTPSSDDIGIWKAVLEVCDSSGTCAEASIIIQVLESDQFYIEFSLDTFPDFHRPEGMLWEDLNEDLYPDILTVGYNKGLHSTFATYEYNASSKTITPGYIKTSQAFPRRSINLGYIDSDDILDAIHPEFEYTSAISVILGEGNLAFDYDNPKVTASSKYIYKNAVLNDFNKDKYLDYAASAGYSVEIYNGLGDGYFQELYSIEFPEIVRSINTADFNRDRKIDLAIGTDSGVYIYHGSNPGTFSFKEFHPQSYGTVDIDITNKGSDFNGDRYFDFVISTPSIGGELSEIVLYSGKTNGTFNVTPVRTIKGQVFGNCIGDFNNDNDLDIAYVNGTFKYIGILYGEGDGIFTNEQRFFISDVPLFSINCVDFDLDGDLDISTIGTDNAENGTLFLLENQDNSMSVVQSSFELDVLNNAQVEVTSPYGKVMNDVSSSFSSSSSYLKNIDQNLYLDESYSLKTLENGMYQIDVTPKIDLPVSEPFSIDFSINNEPFRLAKNIPMSESGYTFLFYPTGNSQVHPNPGEYSGEDKPLFTWAPQGEVDFQLAYDINFTNLIIDSSLSNNHLQLVSALPNTDTTSYFWRIKPTTQVSYDGIYVFNKVQKIPTDIDDDRNQLPIEFSLSQNYPNPFNPSTQIDFSLPLREHVSINIYNINGQKIRTLIDRSVQAGNHSVEWDGNDMNGKKVASGIYLTKINAGSYSNSIKMILMK